MISFHNQSISFKLQEKTKLKQWIKTVTEKEKHKLGTINYIFCTDDELLEINLKHLNHNTLTDIITFDYCQGDLIMGDLFISKDRVIDNAQTNGVSFEIELNRVIVHGVLHLCGYKDKSVDEEKLMRSKEDFYLDRIVPRET
jgi:rRNA maturation RNase YbeY